MKFVRILLLIIICPLLLGAAALQQPIAADQTLAISNESFGLTGPFSFMGQYSEEFGYLFLGRFTQALNKDNAISLAFDLGAKDYRLNATYGYALSAKQRVKLSVEHLAQKIDFSYVAGDAQKWDGQNALGIGYQYLFNRGVLSDINFDAFYSKAESKNLTPIIIANGQEEDLRRIAGGEDESISAGVDLLPLKYSLIGVQLNYSNLSYRKIYEPSVKESGLGYGLNLEQLITPKLKLLLSLSNLAPYQDYQAGIYWLLPASSSTRLELGLIGSRIIGEHGLGGDRRVALNLTCGFDNKQKAEKYSFADENGYISLNTWSATPAVHMEQVLAVKDEAVKIINSNNNSKLSAADPKYLPFPTTNPPQITTSPDEKINQADKILDLFNDPMSYFNSLEIAAVSVPDGLKVTFTQGNAEDNGTLTIAGTAPSTPGTYDLTLKARNYYNQPDEWVSDLQTIKIVVQNVAPTINIPAEQFNYQQQINLDLTQYIKFGAEKLTSVTAAALADYGLAVNLSADGKKITLTGAANKTVANVNIPITVKNTANKSTTGSFKLSIAGTNPIINIPAQSFVFNQTVNQDITSYIQFGSESLASIKADDLAQYGLQIVLENGGKEVKITGQATKAADGIDIPISVTNSANKTTNGSFKLNINTSNPEINIPAQSFNYNQQININITGAFVFGAEKLTSVSAPRLADYGLAINLSADGKTVILSGSNNKTITDAEIPVTVTNSANKSASGNFKLTINGLTPAVNIPEQHYTEYQQVDANITNYINFGAETLKSVSASELAAYGLELKLATDGKKVTITGVPNRLTTGETIPISVTNIANKSINSSFKLTIALAPNSIRCPDPQALEFVSAPDRPGSICTDNSNFVSRYPIGERGFTNNPDNCVQPDRLNKLVFFKATITNNYLVCEYANIGWNPDVTVHMDIPALPGNPKFRSTTNMWCGYPSFAGKGVPVGQCIVNY